MNEIQELEKRLSEELDDLLVADNIEKEWERRFQGSSKGMGMVVWIKDNPRINFKIEVYPNETEEPHFKITYQNCTCRFKIEDCSPMKAELKKGIPTQIQKIMKNIIKLWEKHQEEIKMAWISTRPSNQNHGHQNVR